MKHLNCKQLIGNKSYPWFQIFDLNINRGEGGGVLATAPVPLHVERHLSHWKADLIESPSNLFEQDRTHMIERFRSEIPELQELSSFQVWRQGDDGNRMKVGFPTSKRDAECCVAKLELHKHKQNYWVSRIDKSAN